MAITSLTCPEIHENSDVFLDLQCLEKEVCPRNLETRGTAKR